MSQKSFARLRRLSCERCGTHSTHEVWEVVDAVDRPDLVKRIITGRIRLVNCPGCGTDASVSALLMVLRPQRWPRPMVIPVHRIPVVMGQEAYSLLLAGLQALFNHYGLRDAGVPFDPDNLLIVPLKLLPLAFDRDIGADLEAESRNGLRPLTPLEHHYAEWLGELNTQAWRTHAIALLSALFECESTDALRRLIEENSQLLEERMDDLVSSVMEVLREERPELLPLVANRRLLLRQVRRYGIERVFRTEAER
ncbi:CpXC domain-containing protein [Sinosporangium siamense]|uniref:CpXC domain-containing protein n=1 Tax=Sinosporangium siamense TaxID=1367973 RepID=A0A919RM62_9ACTN|nr:CpXC domain-containing protein [Sinosporangium siamense]GII94691.1 hypothetical protein Ssi02_49220 [Sinosporangium siamense]